MKAALRGGVRVLSVLLVIALHACGGGGGGSGTGGSNSASSSVGSAASDPDRVGNGWITVDSSKLLVSTLRVQGKTFVTARYPKCCAFTEGDTSVSITWVNESARTSGTASPVPSLVDTLGVAVREESRQAWSADIPLVRGSNVITVTATDGVGNTGRTQIAAIGDTTPPSVTSTTPNDGATGVLPQTSVAVTFSEPMAAASISTATLRVEDEVHRIVAGAVSYSDPVATFTPAVPLEPLTTYSVTVTTGVADTTGNPLVSEHVFRFSTATDPSDRNPPTVSLTYPHDGETCVARDRRVEVWFGEPMDTRTLSSAALSLRDPSNGSVATSLEILDVNGVFLHPTRLLEPSSTYTGVVTTAVRDRAGNPLAAEYSFRFTTAAAGPGRWTALNGLDVPTARRDHSAVWTGAELIVWGGLDAQSADYGNGARYRPATDSWQSLPSNGGPAPRFGHFAVWTGSRMLIWGGVHYSPSGGLESLASGGSYDPQTDTWTSVPTAGAPAGRTFATAVWTGSELIVWGGQGLSGTLADGARYRPDTGTWSPVSNVGAPSPRSSHVAVWTGSRMLVWGGSSGTASLASGASYDPVTDSWTALPIDAATPSPRFSATAVWSGSEMLVWGGATQDYRATGARFNPATSAWRPMSASCDPGNRIFHSAIWSGREMIVWGGSYSGSDANSTGGRYDPTTDIWEPLSMVDVPAARVEHTAAWTGLEMIVWGGRVDGGVTSTGARYQPY